MSFMKTLMASAAITTAAGGAALADPALIFDLGGKFDKSFNEAAFNGAQRWTEETGGSYKELEMQSEAQREQALRRLAETGANPIVMTGFAFGNTLEEVAPDHPETKFVIIDAVVEQPNVKSIMFAEQEGSFLVGVLAAMASESKTVGFIGGMDVPLIRQFGCGYAQGVKQQEADAKILANMTGTTPAANRPMLLMPPSTTAPTTTTIAAPVAQAGTDQTLSSCADTVLACVMLPMPNAATAPNRANRKPSTRPNPPPTPWRR